MTGESRPTADKIPVMPVGHDTVLESALAALAAGLNRDPFAVLGPQPDGRGPGVVVRAFQPAAVAIDLHLMATDELRPMTRRDPAGLFEIRVASHAWSCHW